MLNRYFILVAFSCFVVVASAQQEKDNVFPLTLDGVEQRLLANSPDLAIGRAAVAGAKASVQSANTRPNPTLGFSTAGIDPHVGVGHGHLGDKRADSILSLSQVFERGDKRELRNATATSSLAAAQGDFADMLRQQRIAAAAAFFDLLAAQNSAALAVEGAHLARRSATVAEVRLTAGDLARVDVARARTDAARAENDAEQAQSSLRQAQIVLAALLDIREQPSRLRAEGSWPDAAAGSVISRPGLDTLFAGRPDVAAAHARLEAAQSARELVRAQKSRDVTVGIQIEHNPQNPQYTHSPLYGISVSIPLLLGNDYRGDIAKAESDYVTALETLRKVETTARAELENRSVAIDILGRRTRRFNSELLPEARRAADAAEFAFEHGAIGIGDLLDARRTLKSAEQDAVRAQSDHAKALYAWQIEVADTAPRETQK